MEAAVFELHDDAVTDRGDGAGAVGLDAVDAERDRERFDAAPNLITPATSDLYAAALIVLVLFTQVENCTFRDTQGTNPMFGIDLEPDETPYGYLENIIFRNVLLANNLNGGFSMGLYGLVGEPGAENVDVLVDGMEIYGSAGNRTECSWSTNGTSRACRRGFLRRASRAAT